MKFKKIREQITYLKKMRIYMNQQLEGKTNPQNKTKRKRKKETKRKKMPKTLAVVLRFGRA